MLDIVAKAKRPLDFQVVESLFRRLATHADDAELRVPTDLKGWRVGGQASLIHLIITWAKRNQEPRLVLYANNLEDAYTQAHHLGTTHHGLVALIAASDVLTSTTPKKALVKQQRENLLSGLWKVLYPAPSESGKKEDDEEPRLGFWKGSRVLFLSSRQHRQEFPFYFYHLPKGKDPQIRSRLDFIQFFLSVFEEQRKQYKSQRSIIIAPHWDVQDAIGEIVYELFKNSDEHGSKDLKGRVFDNSLRGILLALHSLTDDEGHRLKDEITAPPLKNYLNSFDRDEANKEQSFLEINVFDNGLGLAQQWLGRELDAHFPLEEELKAVNECWGKYNSTSDRDNKGLGLYRVAKTLTEGRGFLRLRTGRLSLYRDFQLHPFPNKDIDPAPNLFEPKELTLLDFPSGSTQPKDTTLLPHSEGLLLTMLLPLQRKHSPNE